MQRFFLFTFETYYPNGGWGDFRSDHPDLESALIAAANNDAREWQVVDGQTRTIVAEGKKKY